MVYFGLMANLAIFVAGHNATDAATSSGDELDSLGFEQDGPSSLSECWNDACVECGALSGHLVHAEYIRTHVGSGQLRWQ